MLCCGLVIWRRPLSPKVANVVPMNDTEYVMFLFSLGVKLSHFECYLQSLDNSFHALDHCTYRSLWIMSLLNFFESFVNSSFSSPVICPYFIHLSFTSCHVAFRLICFHQCSDMKNWSCLHFSFKSFRISWPGAACNRETMPTKMCFFVLPLFLINVA